MSGKKAQPNFVGIGAQKAGTTWLHSQLGHHPQVWTPPIKELHYFDREVRATSSKHLATASPIRRWVGGEEWERPRMVEGVRAVVADWREGRRERAAWNARWYFGRYDDDWYRGLFRAGEGCVAIGEVTPRYGTLDLEHIRHISRVNPEMKIIYFLRNPVDRCWSALRYFVKRGSKKIDLESPAKLVKKIMKAEGIARHSNYLETIANLERVFPGRQVLIGYFDAIERDPGALLRKVWEFLEVDDLEIPNERLRTVRNLSPKRDMPAEVRAALIEIYAPAVREMAERFGGYPKTWRAELEGTLTTASGENLPRAAETLG